MKVSCNFDFNCDWKYWGIGIYFYFGTLIKGVDFQIGPFCLDIECCIERS